MIYLKLVFFLLRFLMFNNIKIIVCKFLDKKAPFKMSNDNMAYLEVFKKYGVF